MAGMKDARDLTPEEAAQRLREIMYAGSSNRATLTTGPMRRAIRELAERAAEAEPPEPSAETVTSHGVGRGALLAGLVALAAIGGVVAAIVLA